MFSLLLKELIFEFYLPYTHGVCPNTGRANSVDITVLNNLKKDPLKIQHPNFENSRLGFIESVHER